MRTELGYIDGRRKFRSQTSDNMQRWKSRGGKSQRGEVKKWEDKRWRKSEETKMQVHEKVGKSRFTVLFQWFVAPEGGSKSNLAKAAGAEPAGQMRDEKVRAVVARSTFPSQKGKNTSRSEHFWKLGCWKSARRCGAKHISKSKCTKHANLGLLLEVELSKKCTPLWREAHVQVKMYKRLRSRTTFGSWAVEKVHAIVARSTCASQNVQTTPFPDYFWKLSCRKSARRCGAKHMSKLKCTNDSVLGPLLEVELSKKCTPLWREAHFQVKIVKTPHVRNCLLFRCRKSAHRCGAKHISKSNVQKTEGFEPFLTLRCRKSRYWLT